MWQRLGVGSLSVSTAVSTSVYTCTSDLRVRCCCLKSLYSHIFLNMAFFRTRVRSRMVSTMPLTMAILLMFFIIRAPVEKLSDESGLALGRGPDLCLDLNLLVSSLFFFFFSDVWQRLCSFSFFFITEKYTLYFVFNSTSDQLHDRSEFSDFRATYKGQAEQVRQVFFLERSCSNAFCT